MASRTMLFDIRSRTWSEDLIRLTGLPRHLFPPLSHSGQVVGHVTRQAANATGLRAGTPVAAGGHDHTCAALAAGVIAPGLALDSSGTVDAIVVSTLTPVLNPPDPYSSPTCGCHAVRDQYYVLGGVMSGAVVDWMVRLFNGSNLASSVEHAMMEAASAPLGANGVWFQPHLAGSGPPHRDANAWGAWLGLRSSRTRADMLRAGMEGLTFGIRDLIISVQATSGSAIAEIRVVGGGARNGWWQQLKANIIGIPVQTLAVSDVTAQGAALLAGIGAGLFADERQASSRTCRLGVRYQVDPNAYTQYDKNFQIYRKHCTALRSWLPSDILKGENKCKN